MNPLIQTKYIFPWKGSCGNQWHNCLLIVYNIISHKSNCSTKSRLLKLTWLLTKKKTKQYIFCFTIFQWSHCQPFYKEHIFFNILPEYLPCHLHSVCISIYFFYSNLWPLNVCYVHHVLYEALCWPLSLLTDESGTDVATHLVGDWSLWSAIIAATHTPTDANQRLWCITLLIARVFAL